MQSLKKLLISAKENIPFYTEKLSGYDLENSSFEEAFDNLPIVDKKLLKANYRLFVDKCIPTELLDEMVYTEKYVHGKTLEYEHNGKNYVTDFTSGTTGTPFVSVKSANERMLLSRDLWYFRNKLSPVLPRDLISLLFNQGLEQFEHLEYQEKIKQQLEYLKNTSYSWWQLQIYEAEKYCEYITKGNPVTFANLKVIEHTGSYISVEEKEYIEKIMKVTLASHYGCREAWLIAYTCKYFHHHLNEKGILTEIIDDDGNIITEPNKPGSLVITTLRLKTMPLIRYEVGDYVCYMDSKS